MGFLTHSLQVRDSVQLNNNLNSGASAPFEVFMKWMRHSGSTIELKDTPEMKKFAESQGWKKDEKKKLKQRNKQKGE